MALGSAGRVFIFLFIGLCLSTAIAGQSPSGRLTGTVTEADGKPIAGVTVLAVDQVTTQRSSARTKADGSYSMRLRAGAYRISVEPPYEARFDQGKTAEYGVFALLICDETKRKCPVLENVIIDGSDRKIDISVVDPSKETAEGGDKPEPKPVNRREARDRWRYQFPEYERYGSEGNRGRDIPFRKGKWWNPYDQSKIKGDIPVIGDDHFMILSAVSKTGVEIRRTPSGNAVSSANPNSNNFFGRPESLSVNQVVQLSFEFFKGQTVFKPRTWAVKISPTFSIPNYLNARENGIVNIDPRRGTNRTDTHVSLEEAFVEVKLFDTNRNYDFVSVRAGIQPFVADFRGFLYSDNNLGTRIFGGWDNNKVNFNAAWFHQLEKDTNSNLNAFQFRHQNVVIGNIFRQDFIKKGYTIQALAAYNDDRGRRHYDTNGFIVRPALIGVPRLHKVQAGYVGFSGDGHLGILNLTHSYFYAFGRDSFNQIAAKKTTISSHMAAAELSIDRNWYRPKVAAFFASGDGDPRDDRATGFDAIFDDPNFVGGQFSYWNRQGIRLLSTDVALVSPNSLLPSLRSSKTEGQANFVNPGIFILNAGLDAELTQTVKAVFNANYLRFHKTEVLKYLLFDPRIRKDIGFDLSLGVIYRPLLINNITMTFGASTFLAGKGFRDVFTDRERNCPIPSFCQGVVPNPSKPQYSLFSEVKLIF